MGLKRGDRNTRHSISAIGAVVGCSVNADDRTGLLRADTRIFQGVPAHFEKQAVLWIDSLRLGRRVPEELRVEAIGVLQDEAARHEFESAMAIRFGELLELLHGEAPHRRFAGHEHLPEFIHGATAGESGPPCRQSLSFRRRSARRVANCPLRGLRPIRRRAAPEI